MWAVALINIITMAPKKILYVALIRGSSVEKHIVPHTIDGVVRDFFLFNIIKTVSKNRLAYIPTS